LLSIGFGLGFLLLMVAISGLLAHFSCFASNVWSRCGQIARCSYYFFMVVVISYKTEATARRALTFIVRIFVNDTIAIAVWTSFSFHVWASKRSYDAAHIISPSLYRPATRAL